MNIYTGKIFASVARLLSEKTFFLSMVFVSIHVSEMLKRKCNGLVETLLSHAKDLLPCCEFSILCNNAEDDGRHSYNSRMLFPSQ